MSMTFKTKEYFTQDSLSESQISMITDRATDVQLHFASCTKNKGHGQIAVTVDGNRLDLGLHQAEDINRIFTLAIAGLRGLNFNEKAVPYFDPQTLQEAQTAITEERTTRIRLCFAKCNEEHGKGILTILFL